MPELNNYKIDKNAYAVCSDYIIKFIETDA